MKHFPPVVAGLGDGVVAGLGGWSGLSGLLGYWATMVWANGLGKATRDIKVIGFDIND